MAESDPIGIIGTPEPSQSETIPVANGAPVKRSAKEWLAEIQQAEMDAAKWCERARKIEKIYLEERNASEDLKAQYALLWANVSVLQPAVYAKQPQPVVTRRFSDRDTIARNVSEVMERSLVTIFDHANIDACLRSVRDDFLVVGQGTAWVRYVPTFSSQQMEDGEAFETIADETLAFDFVHWSDFVHPKCRRWEDLPWVARRVYLGDEEGEARFGKELWMRAKMAQTQPKLDSTSFAPKNKTCVYEIWSRTDKEVVWVAAHFGDAVLDRKPPLYDLAGFFPCPRPAFSTLPTGNMQPIPDYVYYQDQASEINALTAKIGSLEDALKLVGFYPAGGEAGISDAIERAMSAGTGNEMIPVPAWSAFVQGGGSKQMIEWMPLDMVLATLKGAIELRQTLINDVFQITGISDILRGQGQADETATAQSLKAQWGGIRIRDKQAEMARFARDMTRIAGEIVAEKFQPETLWRLAGLQFPTQQQKEMVRAQLQMMQRAAQQAAMQAQQMGQPPQPQQQPEVPPQIQEMMEKPTQEELVSLMRDDRMRSYRIDIETDSTIVADEQAEKESRVEFITMLSGMIERAIPAVQAAPELAPVIGESLLFVTRAFRAGRQLEETIEQAIEAIIQKTKQGQNQPPPPDPKMEKIKADKELGMGKLQLQAQEGQAKLAFEREKTAAELQQNREEFAADVILEREKMQANAAKEAMARLARPMQGMTI